MHSFFIDDVTHLSFFSPSDSSVLILCFTIVFFSFQCFLSSSFFLCKWMLVFLGCLYVTHGSAFSSFTHFHRVFYHVLLLLYLFLPLLKHYRKKNPEIQLTHYVHFLNDFIVFPTLPCFSFSLYSSLMNVTECVKFSIFFFQIISTPELCFCVLKIKTCTLFLVVLWNVTETVCLFVFSLLHYAFFSFSLMQFRFFLRWTLFVNKPGFDFFLFIIIATMFVVYAIILSKNKLLHFN